MDSKAFSKFLNSISTSPLRVLDATIPNSKYIPLNLSKDNTPLKKVDVYSSNALANFVNTHIKRHNALIAYGGYNETRSIYTRSNHFNKTEETERNIHLGVDFWCDAETPIYTPLDATVHSFKNNTNYGDYGPTIILKHKMNNVEFYTLYGHLSLQSIENLRVGQIFKQGACIAKLGDAYVNGDYPPHLHFQIIKDLQNYKGDYPGVCNKNNLAFYLNNCPNPELLLKLDS
ncbi:peptidoglycan DD-metalloendopeptidase family protein [uncultured Algibacter sp.]|uniref:peptidoglycan DD-metalloendopeptidase family protein n=1 Tax=uncultured Algibacter sp. TaxID=298659 RepID=UPI002632AB25|nr:peptidoglycan DD-metalloendopeptidase family protein [uncultured Algibacter sp.]